MSNAKHSIYNEVEFENVVSEMTQEERDEKVAELEADIDDIIAQKKVLVEQIELLTKQQHVLQGLQNMFLYD